MRTEDKLIAAIEQYEKRVDEIKRAQLALDHARTCLPEDEAEIIRVVKSLGKVGREFVFGETVYWVAVPPRADGHEPVEVEVLMNKPANLTVLK